MFTIQFKDDEVDQLLVEAERRSEDMSTPMAEIAEFLLVSTRDRFNQGVDPLGILWAAKSLTTINAYRERAASQNTRIDYRPLHGPSGELASTIFNQSGRDFAKVGSPMVYAAVMQFGAAKGAFGTTSRGDPVPWGDIPARPFLGISDTDQTGVIAILTEWIEGADD